MFRPSFESLLRSGEAVVFLAGPDNVRSQRSVEKLGAVRFGSRPDASGRECVAYRIEPSDL